MEKHTSKVTWCDVFSFFWYECGMCFCGYNSAASISPMNERLGVMDSTKEMLL